MALTRRPGHLRNDAYIERFTQTPYIPKNTLVAEPAQLWGRYLTSTAHKN